MGPERRGRMKYEQRDVTGRNNVLKVIGEG